MKQKQKAGEITVVAEVMSNFLNYNFTDEYTMTPDPIFKVNKNLVY